MNKNGLSRVAVLVLLAAVMLIAIPCGAVLLNFPTGVSNYYDRDGNKITADSKGQIDQTNPAKAQDMLNAGFTLAPTAAFSNSTSAAYACTKGTIYADKSMVYFCYSSNVRKKANFKN